MKKLLAIGLAVAMVLTLAGTAFAAKPGTDFSGPHDTLNLIGKKAGWNGNGSNGNAMFVPLDTSEFTTPNGKLGITIDVTEGSDFEVIDSNAVNDGYGSFQLGPGKYSVYVVALGKPGGSANVTGWIYDGTTYSYLPVGFVNIGGHSGQPVWKDATDLFTYNDEWIFAYLSGLGDSSSYFWQYDNSGDKIVQVRFYPQP